ncbi:MAG: PorT family protein [Prevotellaceae bacterium]|jgi:hypothetical protein|nr:PorT family protein [Prevotellaceae bacterium]
MRISIYILIVITAQLLLPFSLFSQEHYFGVRGGYGMSSVRFDKYQGEKESSGGIDFGISYKLYAEKFMGTQIELNRVHKGYKIVATVTEKDETTGEDKITTTTTTYRGKALELPLMAQGTLRFGGFRILVNAGVYGSYMLSQDKEVEVAVNSSPSPVVKTSGFSDRDNRLGYGIMGGGGFAFQLKKIELQIEARYQYGLGYIMKPKYKAEETLFGHRSHLVFSVALFYNL